MVLILYGKESLMMMSPFRKATQMSPLFIVTFNSLADFIFGGSFKMTSEKSQQNYEIKNNSFIILNKITLKAAQLEIF